jgi:molybdopterin converting factor small subunit
MNRVTVEAWLWLGHELGDDFESPSEMRSKKEEEVREGTTIRELLEHLARRYSPIAEKIFDLKKKTLYPNVVLTYNNQVISPYVVYDQILSQGDKITILPMYVGG